MSKEKTYTYITVKDNIYIEKEITSSAKRIGRKILEAKGINLDILDDKIFNTKGKVYIEKNLVRDMILEVLTEVEGKLKPIRSNFNMGRPKISYPELWEWYYTQWKNKSITALECMANLEVKKTTFYKLVKQYEEMEKMLSDVTNKIMKKKGVK